MFKNSLDNKRYHTLNYFYRQKFNSKVFKIPLNANFSCPNKSAGGCIFCKDNSTVNFINSNDTLINQFKEAEEVLLKKWPNSKYIVYFQAGTNTYTSIKNLKNILNNFITLPKVVGISIATRPDAIDDECLNYLCELNKKTFLTIELGLQTSNDTTLKLINRGHNMNDFIKCLKRLQEKNIFTVAHIINGLPNDTKEDMLNTVKLLNQLKIDGIKIHMLYILKETKIADLYLKNSFHVLEKEEYINIVCDQLELLNEDIVIERITGDPIKEDLIAPTWLLKKFCVLNDIDKEMLHRNSFQGKNSK